MPRVEPDPRLPEHLAPLELPAADGSVRRLGDLWASQPLVLVHLRHFGWLFCRQAVAQLRDSVPDLRAVGVHAAAIGTGDLRYARAFAEDQDIDFPLMVDEDLTTFRLVGAGSGTLRQLARRSVLNAGRTALRTGLRQGRTGPAPMLLGATHVLHSDGTVPFAWRNADVGDNAPLVDVFALLRDHAERPWCRVP